MSLWKSYELFENQVWSFGKFRKRVLFWNYEHSGFSPSAFTLGIRSFKIPVNLTNTFIVIHNLNAVLCRDLRRKWVWGCHWGYRLPIVNRIVIARRHTREKHPIGESTPSKYLVYLFCNDTSPTYNLLFFMVSVKQEYSNWTMFGLSNKRELSFPHLAHFIKYAWYSMDICHFQSPSWIRKSITWNYLV